MIAHPAPKFLMVGLAGFATDAGVLTCLSRAGWSVYLARLASFSLAVTTTWLLNRTWTFARSGGRTLGGEYLAYLSTQSGGAAINLAVFFGILQLLPALRDYPFLPLAAGAFLSMVFTFLMSRHVVFRPRHPVPDEDLPDG